MLRGVSTLIGQALRLRRMSLLAWSLSLAGLIVTYVAMFPSIEGIDFEAILEQYPKELLRAFGFDDTVKQLTTAIGFINTELFGFMLPLAIVFLPVGIIVKMTSRAEEDRYLEALLSAPIARWQLIVAASIAATIGMTIPIIAMMTTGLVTAWIAGVDLTLSEIGGSALSLLPIGALGGSIAVLVVGASRRHGIATAIAAGVIVVMYLMNVLAGFIEFFDDTKGLSIFHYYSDWINKGIVWPEFFAFLAIAAVLTAIGAGLFERRDVG
ncbi:MAG: ABC transporter permease subunit [Thermoleophilaceae bacterium]|nr:ABC transporter permease subunit [Thermoleophilaceae bacterium]